MNHVFFKLRVLLKNIIRNIKINSRLFKFQVLLKIATRNIKKNIIIYENIENYSHLYKCFDRSFFQLYIIKFL